MFRFRQEPSSGSSPVLSYNHKYDFSVLVGIDVVNVMVAYRPVAQACACATGRYAAITLTTSIPTSTEKPYFVVSAKHRTAP
jgi:hypothetical protein